MLEARGEIDAIQKSSLKDVMLADEALRRRSATGLNIDLEDIAVVSGVSPEHSLSLEELFGDSLWLSEPQRSGLGSTSDLGTASVGVCRSNSALVSHTNAFETENSREQDLTSANVQRLQICGHPCQLPDATNAGRVPAPMPHDPTPDFLYRTLTAEIDHSLDFREQAFDCRQNSGDRPLDFDDVVNGLTLSETDSFSTIGELANLATPEDTPPKPEAKLVFCDDFRQRNASLQPISTEIPVQARIRNSDVPSTQQREFLQIGPLPVSLDAGSSSYIKNNTCLSRSCHCYGTKEPTCDNIHVASICSSPRAQQEYSDSLAVLGPRAIPITAQHGKTKLGQLMQQEAHHLQPNPHAQQISQLFRRGAVHRTSSLSSSIHPVAEKHDTAMELQQNLNGGHRHDVARPSPQIPQVRLIDMDESQASKFSTEISAPSTPLSVTGATSRTQISPPHTISALCKTIHQSPGRIIRSVVHGLHNLLPDAQGKNKNGKRTLNGEGAFVSDTEPLERFEHRYEEPLKSPVRVGSVSPKKRAIAECCLSKSTAPPVSHTSDVKIRTSYARDRRMASRCASIVIDVTTLPPTATQAGQVPQYDDLINFTRTKGRGAVHRCVMCGREGRPRVTDCSRVDDSMVVIPSQNKDVCKTCDSVTWQYVETGDYFKWCKGCKRFHALSAFAGKLQASKCDASRARGRAGYMRRKEPVGMFMELQSDRTWTSGFS